VNPPLGEYLAAWRLPALIGAAAFGAVWGSFLNVCIARIPRGISVVSPPSHCFACGAGVLARDNIPILSYLLLRGRCRHCGVKFSARHALIEALAAVLSVLVLWCFALDAQGLPLGVRVARYAVYFAFSAVLVVLTFIDLDTKRLPDRITLPSVVVFFLGGFATGEVGWLERAIGAAAGYAVVRLIADAYYYSTGREGLGLGDGKLLAAMGALLGWKALPPIVFSASFIGIVVSIPVLLVQRQKRGVATVAPVQVAVTDLAQAGVAANEPQPTEQPSIRRSEVPFGPFLAASALGYLFLHRQVWAFIERALLGG
jgi:Type II secretory pathway, prepilin signal peptidase PulO and related peptidases